MSDLATLQLPWAEFHKPDLARLTPAELLAQSQLDWHVSLRALSFGEKPVQPGILPRPGGRVPEHYALVRDTDGRVFDVVGHRYRPTQNADAFVFFTRFIKECRLELDSAGSFEDGRYVWALARTRFSLDLGADDRLQSYVLLISPHKLGRALMVLHTTLRLRCMNMLKLLMGSSAAVYRLSHTRVFDAAAQAEAGRVMGLLEAGHLEFQGQAKLLSQSRAEPLDVKHYFGAIFKMTDGQIANDNPRAGGLMDRLMRAYNGEAPGSQLATAEGTWWGALNAVTYVLDHDSGRDKKSNLRESLVGGKSDMKRVALRVALEMAV